MADMSAWEVLGVPKEVQRGLSEQSFTTPTPIQTLSLPPAIFHHRKEFALQIKNHLKQAAKHSSLKVT